jgi:uncharacterized membrane protein
MASALALGAAIWALLIVLGPALSATSGAVTGVIYTVGAFVCHQRPERSFHWGGAQLPVCARCAGLYLGAAIGACVWAWAGRRSLLTVARTAALRLVAIAGLPTAITVATAWVGVMDPPNAWRAALALPLGAAAGLVVGAVASGHLK